MFTGIYTRPIYANDEFKGLHRDNIPVEYWTDEKYGKLYEMSNWYVENSIETSYLEYTEANFKKLLELYNELRKYDKFTDLIIFGKETEYFDGEFLGYDIVGKKENYISLTEIMLFGNAETTLFSIIYDHFKCKINKNGLFDNVADAKELIQLYKELIDYGLNLERIYDPIPVKIYRYRDICE